MSHLSSKYNLSQETIDKMIKDGIISCSWINYEEVYRQYKKRREECPACSKSELYNRVAETTGYSKSAVHFIISKIV